MQVNIIAKNADVSEDLVKYTERKLGKLTKLSQRVQSAQVIFTQGVSKKRSKSFRVELALFAPGLTLRAEEEKDSFQSALDVALEKLEEQLRRNKTKRLDKTRERPQAEPGPVARVEDDEPSGPVIYIERYEIRPLSLSEAIAKLDLLGRDFLVYTVDNGTVNCVYRRKDGGYGLLVPEEES
jgi:putative sigma-54 modulation protein